VTHLHDLAHGLLGVNDLLQDRAELHLQGVRLLLQQRVSLLRSLQQDFTTLNVKSRCRFIVVHIFSLTQATPLLSVAFDGRVILDAELKSSAS